MTAVRRSYEEAKTNGAAVNLLPGGITVTAVRSDNWPESVLHGAVAHTCYHLNRDVDCLLADNNRVQQELTAIGEQQPILDWVETTVNNSQAIPLFIWREHDTVLDRAWSGNRID